MVGIDSVSQSIDAVSGAARLPRGPGLRGPRAVPADHPAGLGHRPVGQARAQRGDGRRRWAPTWSSCTRRSAGSATTPRGFVEGIADLERRTGIAFAVENMYPWRATSRREMKVYPPGWDPSEESYANTTIDLSHAATAQSDPVAMAERLGDRLRHVHMTDGSGSAKDEHLVPGPRQPAVRPVPGAARRPRLRRATSWSRSTPARPAAARPARPTCSRRWRSAGCTSPAADT